MKTNQRLKAAGTFIRELNPFLGDLFFLLHWARYADIIINFNLKSAYEKNLSKNRLRSWELFGKNGLNE